MVAIKSIGKIVSSLNKYGANKGQKFNELYEQTLYTIDAELPALFKQLEGLPAGKARNGIENKINEIIKNKHRDFEHLELKVMQGIQTKLGLEAIPESQELTLKAMQRMNPEIAEIQKALFEGRPTAEFKELAKKQEKLISQFYGNREEFGIKVAEETKKIQREILEKDLKPEFEKMDKLFSDLIDTKEKLLNLREVDENNPTVSPEIKNAFWKDLAETKNDSQIIIIENNEPPINIQQKINYIKFTNDETIGRRGFY